MRLNLVVDADDTLWENNIYFEDAFTDFCAFLDHSKLSPSEVRAILDEIEIANIKVNGYGSKNFGRNLDQCYRHLVERHIREDDVRQVAGYAERILEQPVELLDGVRETLEVLASRHELTVFTKGHAEEQQLKIDRSGLAAFFRRAAIVTEKDVAAYRDLAAFHNFEPSRTWMVGNSPRSDINPSLAAGWNAVFVPHERTWALEKTDLLNSGPGELKIVEQFSDLRTLF